MALRRYQKPAPKRRGDQWSVLVREDVVIDGQRKRKPKRVPLGPATLTRAEAERLRDEYLAAINHPNVGIGGACLFRDFTRTYERDVLPTLASTSRERTSGVLKNHLVPEFGGLMLREITLEPLQGYFTRLQQSKLSFESVDKNPGRVVSCSPHSHRLWPVVHQPGREDSLETAESQRPKAFFAHRSVLRAACGHGRAVRNHGLRRGVHGTAGQRTGCPEVAEHPRYLDHRRSGTAAATLISLRATQAGPRFLWTHTF